MAAKDDNGEGESSRRARGVDLADIKAAAGQPSTTADREIAAAVTAAKADRVGRFARDEMSDAASAHLKRELERRNLLRTAADRYGFFGSSIGTQAARDALEVNLAGTTASAVAQRAMIDGRHESYVDKTAREIVEADRRASEFTLGQGMADKTMAAIHRADREAAGLYGARTLSTGLAVADALRDTYALLGSSASRDQLLGYVTGVGSLAPIAAGLADSGSMVAARTEAMLLEAQQRLLHGDRLGSIDGALRASYGDLFPPMRSPRASEIEAVLTASAQLEALKSYPDWAGEARGRYERMTIPWVRQDMPDASIAAMVRLNEIDRLVEGRAPAALHVVELLRIRLGDYRGAPEPDAETLNDPIARTGYQIERGLDPVLTVLPTAVLATMFAPFAPSDPDVPIDADALENAVRMLLKRLERALRRFIAAKLKAFYGDDWFDRMPSEIRRSWAAGRQKDIDDGRAPDELIAYADINDYSRIIEHPERWGSIFEATFKDKVAIAETLRRIAVIRNPGAHFRAVTVEDLIILRAEGVHLAKWLGVRLGD